MNLFINTLIENPQAGVPWLLAVVFSICCHEYAHAWMAVKCGDDTPILTGHLTLSPLKQMGWMSILMLAFTGIAWGMVPVDDAKLKSRRNRVLTAAAGPLTNLLLCIVFLLLLVVAIRLQWNGRSINMFSVGAGLNLSLFCFNMLPVPPLDGFAVIRGFFPGLRFSGSQLLTGIYFFLIILVFMFAAYIFDLCFFIVEMAAAGVLSLWQ